VAGTHAHLYRKSRWKKKSEAFRLANPLCEYCKRLGSVRPSEVADHAVPHKGNEQSFWHGKLIALCKECHDNAKRLEEHGRVGFDSEGNPLAGVGGWA